MWSRESEPDPDPGLFADTDSELKNPDPSLLFAKDYSKSTIKKKKKFHNKISMFEIVGLFHNLKGLNDVIWLGFGET